MFANQHAFAQQVAGTSGMAAPMPNPYPSYGLGPSTTAERGAEAAGTFGKALPGLVGIGTMGASMIGYKSGLGLLDPFTGISRAFGAGVGGGTVGRAGLIAGRSGMGVVHAGKAIGSAFTSGGLRAGLGAIGGGLAGAAVAALPYYLAGKAIGHVGEQIYEGAQDFRDVGRMTKQYFDPDRGAAAGARGAPGTGTIRAVTDTLREMASRDTMRDMKDMRRLMDQAGGMGMLQGVTDATQFKEKFGKVLKSAKAIAVAMGSSVEEALPTLRSLNQMGLWTAQDVMGVSAEMRAVGPRGAQAMMGTMQAGAQMSHALGGTLKAGAQMGRNMFGQISTARQMGILSAEDVREFTGGVGGARGQQMMATNMQQILAGMGRTALGRRMMVRLGEVREGRFTGDIDPERLERFQRGERLERRRMTGRMATSFYNREGEISQSLAARGGIETLAQGIRQVAQRHGLGDDPDYANMLLKKLTGANQRQANTLQEMIRNLPRIRAERERSIESAIEDSFREAHIRRNRSWQGFSDAVGSAWDEMNRPLKELGQNLAVGWAEGAERLEAKLLGRARQMPKITQQRMMNLQMSGALSDARAEEFDLADLGVPNVGQAFVDSTPLGDWTARMRGPETRNIELRGGVQFGGQTVGAETFEDIKPMAMGFLEAGLQTRRGEVGDEGRVVDLAKGEVDLGGGLVAKEIDMKKTARRAIMRSRSARISTLFGEETTQKREAQNTINERMRQVLSDPARAPELRKLKEDSPRDYGLRLMREIVRDPETSRAFRVLSKDHPEGVASEAALLDTGAIAMRETRAAQGDLAIEFERPVEEIAGMALGDTDNLEEAQRELISEMTTAAGATGRSLFEDVSAGAASAAVGMATGVAGYAAIAAATGVGAVPGAIMAGGLTLLSAVGGGIYGAIEHAAGEAELSEGEFAEALTSDQYTTKDVLDYLEGRGGEGNKFGMAAFQGGAAGKLQKLLDRAKEDPGLKQTLVKGISRQGAIDQMRAITQERERVQRVAGTQPIGDIRGVSAATESRLEEARKSLAAGDKDVGFAKLRDMRITDPAEVKMLRRGEGGAIGQQAVLMQDISEMGRMTAGEFKKFRKDLRETSGVNLISSLQARLHGKEREDFEKMLQGGLTSREATKLQGMLEQAAPQAFGRGAGRRGEDPFMRMLTEYTAANRDFVQAVKEFAGDKGVSDAGDKVATMPTPTKKSKAS